MPTMPPPTITTSPLIIRDFLSLSCLAPILSEHADQVNPATRVRCARLPVLSLERRHHWRLGCGDGTSSPFSAVRQPRGR